MKDINPLLFFFFKEFDGEKDDTKRETMLINLRKKLTDTRVRLSNRGKTKIFDEEARIVRVGFGFEEGGTMASDVKLELDLGFIGLRQLLCLYYDEKPQIDESGFVAILRPRLDGREDVTNIKTGQVVHLQLQVHYQELQ